MGILLGIVVVIIGACAVIALLKILWHIATVSIGELLIWIFGALLPVLFPFIVVGLVLYLLARALGMGRTEGAGHRSIG